MLEERPLFTHKGDRETGSTGGGAGTRSEVDSSPQPSPAHRVARDRYQALEKPTQVRAVVLPASSASAWAPPTGLNPQTFWETSFAVPRDLSRGPSTGTLGPPRKAEDRLS